MPVSFPDVTPLATPQGRREVYFRRLALRDTWLPSCPDGFGQPSCFLVIRLQAFGKSFPDADAVESVSHALFKRDAKSLRQQV